MPQQPIRSLRAQVDIERVHFMDTEGKCFELAA
jgi:hypothetical protein